MPTRKQFFIVPEYTTYDGSSIPRALYGGQARYILKQVARDLEATLARPLTMDQMLNLFSKSRVQHNLLRGVQITVQSTPKYRRALRTYVRSILMLRGDWRRSRHVHPEDTTPTPVYPSVSRASRPSSVRLKQSKPFIQIQGGVSYAFKPGA